MVCEYEFVKIMLMLFTIITTGNIQSTQQQSTHNLQSQSSAIMAESGVESAQLKQLGVVQIPEENKLQQLGLNVRYDAPDDCHFMSAADIDQPEILLTCNLRTVNSEFDTTNFSVIPADNTVGLHVLCNNEIMAKSSLEPRSFAHLIRLQDLSIQYCKLPKFSRNVLENLSQLRNLTIRTNNILWPSINFVIESDAFAHVKNLERLDLSSNNIWSLPDNIFCSLNRLWSLNMSENRLQDINELGFRDHNKEISNEHLNTQNITKTRLNLTCNLDLEIIDVSFNHFVLMPANGFATLKRLRVLQINNNEISMIADKALNGLKNLQILHLSSNKIVALPAELFMEQLSCIQEIYLQNNSISVLSPKLFSNLEQLQALDLSMNQISSTWIDRSTFIGLIRLVLLNLSHNKLTKLESEIFADLYTLQILNLRYNHLESIAADTFAPMNNLHTLLLSHNKLKYLDAYALNGLYVLSLLSLDNNALLGIHPDAFRNCSALQDLNLNGNQLKRVPLALHNMRLLRTVDLGENSISVLEDSAFKGLSNLYGLRLIGNFLDNITANAFKDLPNLQILNLARNRIGTVEAGTFEMISSIQAIRLDGNDLSEISGLFSNMPSLLWLNVSDNRLDHFDYEHVPKTLQWLDLHKNHLIELSNNANLDSQIRLQTLDASFNKILRITPSSLPNSIELLFLNDNLINTIDPDTFTHKNNLTRVDLYANQITTLDIKSLRILQINEKRPLPEFYIGGNPFICDCNSDWLQKINHLKSRQYPRIMDLETIYCKLLNNRERAYIPLIEAEPQHFLCTYKTHCFAVCHCCEFDACDCEMTCPSNCTCFHDQTWSTNIVECSVAGYSQMPRKVPMDTTELYIDGNNFVELAGHTFLGRKNLAVLFINNSNVQYIYNTTFSGLKRLMALHLEDNHVTIIQGNEFSNLENLRELYLQNNRITSIGNGSFQELHKLEVLRLDGNRLLYFEVWQLELNPYLVEIGLSNNQWSCECSYLMHFRTYLGQNADKIIDAPLVSCVYNNATSILREKNGTKCTLGEDIATYVHASEIGNLLPSLLYATCAFIVFFIFIMAIFWFRHELKIWAHTSCLINLCFRSSVFTENLEKNRFYDAYFAYSLQDDHFVNQILVNTLENEIGFRLCLHYRDISINAYITDSIIEAAENAKHFVMILSKNFLYNEWTRFEYKSAIHEITKRHKRIVFILYGDLPQRDIDMDMRHYLRTSTCIEWDDKKFWQKLRIALPHIRNKRKTNCLSTRSAVNIYATSHEYQSTNAHLSDKHFTDCNNYATISDCARGYASIPSSASNCKYNTLNELSHKNQKTDFNKISSGAKTLDHKRHYNLHEYAVPSYLNAANNHLAGASVPTYDSVDYTQQLTLQTSPNDCDCNGSSKRIGVKGFHASFSSNFASLPQSSNGNDTRINDDSVNAEYRNYICHKPCNCRHTESEMQLPSFEQTGNDVHSFCHCNSNTSNRPSSRSSASTSSSTNNSNDTSRQPELTNYESNLSLNDINSLNTMTRKNVESTESTIVTKDLWA